VKKGGRCGKKFATLVRTIEETSDVDVIRSPHAGR
jgi:hypothetical protein